MRRSLVNLLGIVKVCDKSGDRMSKTNYSCNICMRLKGVLDKTEKYGTLCIHAKLQEYHKF